MNPRLLLGVVVLLTAIDTANAQVTQNAAAAVEGRVTDVHEQPLPGAVVTIDGTSREGVSDADGRFRIDSLGAGRYTLRVTLSGYTPATHAVELSSGESHAVSVSLAEGTYVFERVLVVESGYGVKRSLTSTRTNTELRDLPQSIQVINKDLIEDQGATYLNDALRNVSGVTQFSEYLDFNIRGFRSQSDGAVKVDGLNLVHDFFVKPRLLNVERIEVVKGPAGALYGQSKPGGFVNMITKQPSAQRQSRVVAHLGSWDKSEVHASSTGALPAFDNVFYLVDAAHLDNKGFRLHEQFVYTGLAGSVTWAPTAKTSVTVGGDWFDDLARGHRNRGVPFYEHRLVDVPASFTVNEPTDLVQIDAMTARTRVLHELGNDWRVDASVGYLQNDNIQQYHEPMGLRPGGSLMLREFRDQYREKQQTSLNANLNWTPLWAGIRHSVLVGTEYSLMNGLLQSGTARDSSRGGPVPDLDIYTPVYGTASQPLSFGYYGASIPGGITTLSTSTNNRVRASGVYLQDQVAIGSRVNLLAGVRWDDFRDDTRSGAARARTGHALSLRAGGVVDLARQWSAYANYAEGFEPPAANISLEPERFGGPFDPETSWSFESGVKGLLFGDRVTTTASLYHITKRDMLLRSPTADMPDRYVPVGSFESRGLELDLAGRITSRLSLYANYAHSFLAEVTQDVNPLNIGKSAENNPAHAGSVWARYNVWESGSWHVGVAGGITAVGKRLTFEAGDELPRYTKGDAAVFVDVQRLSVALNLFNVSDERFFTGGYGGRNGGFLGAPRNVELRLAYRF